MLDALDDEITSYETESGKENIIKKYEVTIFNNNFFSKYLLWIVLGRMILSFFLIFCSSYRFLCQKKSEDSRVFFNLAFLKLGSMGQNCCKNKHFSYYLKIPSLVVFSVFLQSHNFKNTKKFLILWSM